VVGAPAQHAKVEIYDKHSGSIGARVLFYWTVPPRVSDWPVVSTDPLDIANDFIVDYPTDDQMKAEGFPSINLPHPGGISGGGIWDQGFESETLWAPQKSRLIAIQSRWCSKQRYLRAIQVHHWLRLLHRDFPDLRQPIEESHGTGSWEIT
jgi:hypothetical protein